MFCLCVIQINKGELWFIEKNCVLLEKFIEVLLLCSSGQEMAPTGQRPEMKLVGGATC